MTFGVGIRFAGRRENGGNRIDPRPLARPLAAMKVTRESASLTYLALLGSAVLGAWSFRQADLPIRYNDTLYEGAFADSIRELAPPSCDRPIHIFTGLPSFWHSFEPEGMARYVLAPCSLIGHGADETVQGLDRPAQVLIHESHPDFTGPPPASSDMRRGQHMMYLRLE